MSNQPFIIEQVYDVPVSKVWDAITDNEQMKKWYFQMKDFKPVVGFEFSFSG
ncbi:MAG TPA: SRPBCC domain-containing protein, partial [Candidatus Paceibacterota bacterium]|nr:SRPBCC domain-containing protein [Candidatus Paceibacterota bacterium]